MIPFIPWYIELATLVTNVVIAAGVWMIVSAGTPASQTAKGSDRERAFPRCLAWGGPGSRSRAGDPPDPESVLSHPIDPAGPCEAAPADKSLVGTRARGGE
jgi:hypothetical protein